MHEVIMEYSSIIKNFGILIRVKEYDEKWQLIPTNKEIIPYLKYFKTYSADMNGGGHCDLLNDIVKNKINDHNFDFSLTNTNLIYEGEGIIFEFPDEETSFYFKLKFC